MKRKWAVVWLLCALLVLAGCPPSGQATLSGVSPGVIVVGSPDTLLTLTGQNFTQPAAALWIGLDQLALPTTFVNSTRLVATVPAKELVSVGSASVRAAFGQGQNQTVTVPLTITISNTVPTLTSMSPMHILTTASSLTLSLQGTNYNTASVVNWGSTALATTYVSPTQLTAVVPTSLYASAGTVKVTVVNSGTGGGTSAGLTETVVGPFTCSAPAPPNGSVGSAYSLQISCAGGVTPYSYAVTTGSLPTGLSLGASTGLISGTPTTGGTASFTVTCTDSTGTLQVIKFKK